MKVTVLGMLAETPIHPGTGRSLGVIDLPVAREAATDYPVLVGSSMKGALRDKAGPDLQGRFGDTSSAGEFLVSDSRLLLLPVRSLTGAYRWVTCPLVLERLRRDLQRAGQTKLPPALDGLQRQQALGRADGPLFLEERRFSVTGPAPAELVSSLQGLVRHPETRGRVADQLVVLGDDDFAWFARYGLAVQARNVLSRDGRKRSENLWYEETLPPDTLMYCLVASRSEEAWRDLGKLFAAADPYIQVGGNETVGHGWFAVQVMNGKGAS